MKMHKNIFFFPPISRPYNFGDRAYFGANMITDMPTYDPN
jgi:hypothetical protein